MASPESDRSVLHAPTAHGAARPGARFVLLLAALMALAYWRAPLTFFAIDDFVYLRMDWRVWRDAVEFFVYPRGLAESLFAIHRRLFGTQYFYYHLLPLGLHLLNALMVHRLVRWAAPGVAFAAPVASVIFALHPAAFTTMMWLSVGFETVPCLTFTLLAAHLFVWHVERGGWAALPLSVASMAVAVAFKTHAVLMPVYLVALGTLAVFREGTPTGRRRTALRVAASLVPFLVFEAWFAVAVLPHVPHLDHPSYRRDFSPGALWNSYVLLLSQTFNFLPIFREPIGGQLPIPDWFRSNTATAGVYHGALGAAGLGVAWLAVKRGHGLYVAAMMAIVVGGLSYAAPMTRHLEDYYSYFVLPAACAVLALPFALLAPPFSSVATRTWRAVLIVVLLGYAFASGGVLYGTNGAVRQAAGARTVDDFVRTSVAADQDMVFVPPNWLARLNTVEGASVTVMQPDRRGAVRLPPSGEAQTVFRSTAGALLVSLDDLTGRGPRIYTLDLVQWADRGNGPVLEWDRKIVQPFEVQSDGFSEVHVRLAPASPSCEIEAAIVELTIGADPAQVSRVRVGGGAMPCTKEPFQVIPVTGQRQSSGKSYELHLKAMGRSAVSLFHVAPVPPGLSSFVEHSSDVGGESPAPSPAGKVLAFRVVLEGPRGVREGPAVPVKD